MQKVLPNLTWEESACLVISMKETILAPFFFLAPSIHWVDFTLQSTGSISPFHPPLYHRLQERDIRG